MAVRDFRRLLWVRLVGQCGDGAFQTALLGAALFNPDKAGTAAAAAVAFAVLLLPYSAIGPFTGIVLDRWSRQRILLIANVLRALLVTAAGISLGRSGATSATTLLLALATVSVNRFILSGLSASLPRVVEHQRLVTANALTTTLGTAAAAAGGLLSLQLRRLWGGDDSGAALIALVAAIAYLLAAALVTRIGTARLGPAAEPDTAGRKLAREQVVHVIAGLRDGARHLRSRRAAARALLTISAQRFFSGLAFVMVLMLYTPHGFLHRGFGGLGIAVAATVAGGLTAALVTPAAVRRLGGPRWIVLALAASAVIAAAGLAPYTHEGLVAAGLGLGFASQATKICVDTLLQEAIDDGFRGRVFALYDMLFNVSFVAAAAAAAVLVPDNGHSLVVVLLVSVGYALTALACALLLRPEAASIRGSAA